VPTVRSLAQLARQQVREAVTTLEPALVYELGMMCRPFLSAPSRRGTTVAVLSVGASWIGSGLRFQEEIRQKYEEFFSLWKEADPDIPVFQRAKLELEKLR
jgi:hypothetical protein